MGGGISGLSVAYFLSKRGLRVLLLEKEKRFGGKIRTVREDGYTVEAGPNAFLSSKPHAAHLAEELGIGDRVCEANQRANRRFLFVNGRLVEIPVTPGAFFKTELVSLRAKLRLLLEPFIPKGESEDETVASFVTRRLGREFLRAFVDPMASGIYAGVPERMSMRAAFPLVWRLEREHGSLIRGMLKLALVRKGRGESGPAGGGRLLSFLGGVGELVEALESCLRERVDMRLSTPARLFPVSGGWVVEYGTEAAFARAAVVSTPAYAVGAVVDGLKELGLLAKRIEYAPIAVVALGFRREDVGHPLDGFGFLVARDEGMLTLGVLWDSSIFPNRAPGERVLMRVMLGGARNPVVAELDEEELYQRALEEVGNILDFRSEPERVWIFKYDRGIPQYGMGHADLVDRMEGIAEAKGLFLHSNAYRGVGFSDCIGNAALVADKVVRYLGYGGDSHS